MVLLQQLASVPLATFGDVAEFILIKIMQHQNVYFVTDQYTPGSIKTYERERRKESGSIRISIERRDQLRPKQWSKFLKDGENKKDLIKFLFHEWSSNHEKYVKYLESRSLFVNHGEQFHKLTVKKGIIHCQEVTKLATDQEEADTKVFLAAKHASQYSDGVCIKTVDSDIPIYALYFAHKIKAKIFVEMMCCNKRRVLDINDIREELGEELCLALPGLHAFTGNGYTSAFHGLGKKKPFTMTKNSPEYQRAFSSLGDRFVLDVQHFPVIEQFVCELYGVRNCSNTDKARYKKFCDKKKTPEPQKLPPTRDVLLCHLKRVNYVTAIIKRSLKPFPKIPKPGEVYGWVFEDGTLNVQWMLRNPIPEELMDLIACSCKKTMCATNQCICRSHKLKCTDLCTCKNECENKQQEDDLVNEDGNGEITDEDDVDFDIFDGPIAVEIESESDEESDIGMTD